MINNKVEDIKYHFEEIMRILDLPITESNRNTPLRISKMYANEVFKHRNNYGLDDLLASMKLFPIDNDGEREMVIMRDIKFNSMCEHHFMPFSGIVNVGYVPEDTVIGLSKIPRAVKFFSKKPQLQERLVNEIADFLFEIIQPKLLIVDAIATHTCVGCRGIETPCDTITFAYRGSKEAKMDSIRTYSAMKGEGIKYGAQDQEES